MIAFTCAFDVDSGESAFQTDYIRSDEVRDEEDISGTQGSCHKTGLKSSGNIFELDFKRCL